MLLFFDYLLLFNLAQAAISDDESPPATLTTHPPKVIFKIPSYLHQLCAYMCILQNKNITSYIHLLFPVEHSCIGTSTKFTAAHGWQFVKEEMMILKDKEMLLIDDGQR